MLTQLRCILYMAKLYSSDSLSSLQAGNGHLDPFLKTLCYGYGCETASLQT